MGFVVSHPFAIKKAKEWGTELVQEQAVKDLAGTDQLFALCAPPVVALHVLVEDLLEVGYYGVAAQRGGELAVDINRRLWLFKRAGQADAEVGVLRLSGTVDDAAHDS